MVVYNGSKSLNSLQNLSLLCCSTNTLPTDHGQFSTFNENNNNPNNNSSGQQTIHHLISRLSQSMNEIFVKALLGDGNNDKNEKKKQMILNALRKMMMNKENGSSSSLTSILLNENNNGNNKQEEIALWLNHALHYSGLNIWWNDRFIQFEKLLMASNSQQQKREGENNNETIMNTVVESAERGRFGLEVVTAAVNF